MPLIPHKDRVSTILFRIPHIQNLLIFKNSLNKKDALVAIIIELLKLGDTDLLYVGYDNHHTPSKEAMSQLRDSAIVRLMFPKKDIIRRDISKTIDLIIDELQLDDNHISIACDTLSYDRNITAVALSVESETPQFFSRISGSGH